jgi:hypothetical protein
MDTSVKGIARISFKEYRKVRLDTNCYEASKNFIDGDFIEQFLGMDEHSQAKIAQNMLFNSHDFTPAYLMELK